MRKNGNKRSALYADETTFLPEIDKEIGQYCCCFLKISKKVVVLKEDLDLFAQLKKSWDSTTGHMLTKQG